MSLLSKIFSSGAKEITDSIGGVLDGIITNEDEKLQAKAKLSEIVLNSLNKVQELQSEVLKAEITGNWLQRSWRPITMLTFTAIVVVGAFKQLDYLNVNSPFWDLLQLGLGGYVVGRSVEKVADTVTKNIDMTFLKKKDR